VRGVTPNARNAHRVVLADRVVGRAGPTLGFRLGAEGRRPRPAENRRMASTALGVSQTQAHLRRLAIGAGQKLDRIEASDGPHREMHTGVSTAVTGNASNRHVFSVMGAGQIRRGGRGQANELLVMEMARYAEPVVPLFGGQRRQEEGGDQRGARPARCPTSERPSERAGDGENLLGLANCYGHRLGEHYPR
jgi:hypothetical protein